MDGGRKRGRESRSEERKRNGAREGRGEEMSRKVEGEKVGK